MRHFASKDLRKKKLQGNCDAAAAHQAQSERQTLIPNMSGGGKKYQDQKLGSGIDKRPEDPNCGSGSRYQDHRLAAGATPMPKGQSNQAQRYQDHRLGKGPGNSLPQTTGNAKQYQDHRIGSGLSGSKPPAQGQRYQDHRHGGVTAATRKTKFTFRK